MVAFPARLETVVRSAIVAVALLVLVVSLVSVLRPSGLLILSVTLWLSTLGAMVAGAFLIIRARRPIAGVGAIVTAVTVLLAFFWREQPGWFVWQVGFLAGIILVAFGTREDTHHPVAWPLLLVRFGVGWAFVDNAQDHLRSGWPPGGGGFLQTATTAANRSPAFFLDPPYQAFLKGTVVPGADTWAALTASGELAFGLLLALGLFTPVAAVGLIWHSINYILMKGFLSHSGYVDKTFFLAEAFCLFAGAGLAYGIDASLWRHMPDWVAKTFMGVSRVEPDREVAEIPQATRAA